MKTIDMIIPSSKGIDMSIGDSGGIDLGIGGGSSGTSNYNALTNKPSINGVTLVGNKVSREIYVQDLMEEITEQDIDEMIYGGN